MIDTMDNVPWESIWSAWDYFLTKTRAGAYRAADLDRPTSSAFSFGFECVT